MMMSEQEIFISKKNKMGIFSYISIKIFLSVIFLFEIKDSPGN